MLMICAQCKDYLGAGDWDLCCRKQHRRLTYEYSEACELIEPNTVVFNASMRVGCFRCSVCGKMIHRSRVDTCPNCGGKVMQM